MKSSIYKTPWGLHIDLDHLQMVGEPHYMNRMGRGGLYVGVNLRFALQDKWWEYERPLNDNECRFVYQNAPGSSNHEVLTVDGEWIEHQKVLRSEQVQAVKNLAVEVNQILAAWKEWKQFTHS